MILSSLEYAARTAAPTIANHLWQSTLFACAMAAATLAFKRNRARVRFGLWLAASIKFLIPFSLLIGLGSSLARPRVAVSQPVEFYSVVQQVSQPFTPSPAAGPAHPNHTVNLLSLVPEALALVWLAGFIGVVALWTVRWRRVSASARTAAALEEGREVEALRHLERVAGLRKPTPLLLSRDSMEPGVFGIFRPVLLWPMGISDHLEEAHLRAILAHEVDHVRRRDNLAAALHMLVEAAFWFHPLVWWIGARLVEERESACDEEVMGLGNEPEAYAESILKACKFCVESPLNCVSGVAGSNLKKRIVRIMNQQFGMKLSFGGRMLLAAIGIAAIAMPVAIGMFNPAQAKAQDAQTAAAPAAVFDTATVKLHNPEDKNVAIKIEANQFTGTNVTLKSLIAFAYGVEEYQIAGGPEWVDQTRFDVDGTWKQPAAGKYASESKWVSQSVTVPGAATEPGAHMAPPPPTAMMSSPLAHIVPDSPIVHVGPGPLQTMMRTLLAERFNLKLTNESREQPTYELLVANNGAKLIEAEPAQNGTMTMHMDNMTTIRVDEPNKSGNNELDFTNGTTAVLARSLSQSLGRQVIDKTGLKGHYNISLRWAQGNDKLEGVAGALNEQLGLTLESAHGPVNVMVIDMAVKPAE